MSFETEADRGLAIKFVGELVTLSVGTNKWAVYAAYDRAFVEIAGVEAFRPVLVLREIDCRQPPARSVLATRAEVTPDKTMAGVFDVVGFQPDGTGLATLILEATT